MRVCLPTRHALWWSVDVAVREPPLLRYRCLNVMGRCPETPFDDGDDESSTLRLFPGLFLIKQNLTCPRSPANVGYAG